MYIHNWMVQFLRLKITNSAIRASESIYELEKVVQKD
jgi:hypothetical protein